MAYIYDLTDTWSAGGTVFNAIKINVTDSASAVTSKLVSLQTNGTEHFSVTKAGAGYFSGSVGIGITPLANTRISVRTATVTDTAYYADNGVNSGFKVKFASSLTSILNDFGADLVLGTNDTERMRIDAAGAVGIGTASPATKLDVAGAITSRGSTNPYLALNNGTATSYVQVTSGTLDVRVGGANPITFNTNSAERMRIDASGNVGIGVAATYQLQVRGVGQDTAAITDAGNKGGSLYLQASGVTSGSGGTLLFGTTFGNATPFAAIKGLVSDGGTNTTGDLAFSTRNAISDTALTERMRIALNGNVGIGTSSPSSKLDVNGKVTLTGGEDNQLQWTNNSQTWRLNNSSGGQIYLYNVTGAKFPFKVDAATASDTLCLTSTGVGIGTSSPDAGLTVIKSATISSQVNVAARIGSGVTSDLLLGSVNGNTPFVASQGAYPVTFFTNATERMRLDSLGQLGIGTSSPGYRLDVAAGDTTAGLGYGVRVRSNATAAAAAIQFTNSAVSAENGLIACTDGGRITVQGSTDMAFRTNGTERARIDSSGNVGVGTVSPAYKLTVQSSNAAAGFERTISRRTGDQTNFYRTSIVYNDSASASGPYAAYSSGIYHEQGGGFGASGGLTFATNNANAGPITFATADAERMRIDSSGQVGIGTSSPTVKLQVISDGPPAASGNMTTGMLVASGGSSFALNMGANSTGGYTWLNSAYTNNSGIASPMVFMTGAAERARIDASGNLLVGTTSTGPNPGIALVPSGAMAIGNNAQASGWGFINFNRSGTAIGSITQNGTTGVLYNTSSDVRLKDNINDADDAASLIDAIQVRKFDWKADGSHQRYGFVAQELVTVAPEAVSQPADPDDMMGVDYSKLVPMLVKEIQSMRLRLAQLEGN